MNRISLLASGREIVAEVVPVDPRDLFRGEYVILNYTFTRTGEVPVPDTTRSGDTLYVTLKPGAEPKSWEIVSASDSYPANTAPGECRAQRLRQLRERQNRHPARNRKHPLWHRELFRARGQRQGARSGSCAKRRSPPSSPSAATAKRAIKALEIDGKRIVEEPLL